MKKILIFLLMVRIFTIANAQESSKNHIILFDISGSMDDSSSRDIDNISSEEVKGCFNKYLINDAVLHSNDRVNIAIFYTQEKITNVTRLFASTYSQVLSPTLKEIIKNVELSHYDTDLIEALKNAKGIFKENALNIIWLFTDNIHDPTGEENKQTTLFYKYLDETEEFRKIYFFPITKDIKRKGLIIYSILFSPTSCQLEKIKNFDLFIKKVSQDIKLPSVPYTIPEDALKVEFLDKDDEFLGNTISLMKGFTPNKPIEISQSRIKLALISKFPQWIVEHADAEVEIEDLSSKGSFKFSNINDIKTTLQPNIVETLKFKEKYNLGIEIPPVKTKYSLRGVFQSKDEINCRMNLKVIKAKLVPTSDMNKIDKISDMIRNVSELPPATMTLQFTVGYPLLYPIMSFIGAVFIIAVIIGIILLINSFLNKTLSCTIRVPEGERSFVLSPLKGYNVESMDKAIGQIRWDLFRGLKFVADKEITIGAGLKTKELKKEGITDFIVKVKDGENIPVIFEVERKKITRRSAEVPGQIY